jgi:hypothetical protein
MRQGQQATLVLSKNGEICAISTGSDYVSEHEWGYKHVQETLCTPLSAVTQQGTGLWIKVSTPAKVQEVCMTQRFLKSEAEIIAALRAGERVGFPPMFQRTALGQNLDQVHFVKGEEDGKPVAVFGYSIYGPRDIRLDHPELALCGKECAGAWDSNSFAFKVRGADLVAKLEKFFAGVMRGDCFFADTFLKTSGATKLKGIAIAHRPALSAEQWDAMYFAQLSWEQGMRHKASVAPVQNQAAAHASN